MPTPAQEKFEHTNRPTIEDEERKHEVRSDDLKRNISETTQMRQSQIRKLLEDAETANAKGKYLDAALGFGEAALLYPEELAHVEPPEKIRTKFLDALKRYQSQVERTLDKAGSPASNQRQTP
jgi:predicted ATPase